MSENRKWYVLRVNVSLKGKVISTLEGMGAICFTPVSGQSQGIAVVNTNEPGFLESLVFIKADVSLHKSAHTIKGVENFLYWRQSLANINEKEILLLRYFAEIRKDLFFEKIPVNPDGEIVLSSGPFLLKQGDSYDVKSHAIKAVLPSMGYIVAAETDEDFTNPVLVLNAQQDIRFVVEK